MDDDRDRVTPIIIAGGLGIVAAILLKKQPVVPPPVVIEHEVQSVSVTWI